jgi:hypothetical protein
MITAIRVPAGVLAVSLLVTGCAQGGHATAPRAAAAEAVRQTSVPAPARSASTAPSELPGLGPGTLAEVPSTARQVVVVTGEGKDSSDATVVLHERTASGWQAGREWPAHNALKGWTSHHTAGDLHSPIGVFSLTDAGGLLPDPGTRLPYDHSGGFAIVGTGFEGESLSGSFDYVVAIDYNRKPGTSPRDWTRPL